MNYEGETLGEALLAVQKEAPALQRDAINPHFKNKYVSLDSLMGQILPVLHKHGFVLVQSPTVENGEPALRTKLLHAPSGEAIEDTMLLVLGKTDPQGQGSAITYARRYSLMSILGLVADEDDDANAARPRQRREKQNGGSVKAASGPDVDKLRSLLKKANKTEAEIEVIFAHHREVAGVLDTPWVRGQIERAERFLEQLAKAEPGEPAPTEFQIPESARDEAEQIPFG